MREILCQHASDVASSPFTNDQMVRLKDQHLTPTLNLTLAPTLALALALTRTLTLTRYGSSSRTLSTTSCTATPPPSPTCAQRAPSSSWPSISPWAIVEL